MLRLLTLLLLSFIFSSLFGQQQATFSQYMFNGLAINPAYAGSQEVMSMTALARYQSLGVPGAPNTQSFSAHSPLLNNRAAVGLLVVHDNIGVIDQLGINAIYAYRIHFDEKRTLSFGIQGGVSIYDANYTELELPPGVSDPAFNEDVKSTRPNFGFGVYYSSDVFYAGASIPQLVNNVFERGSDLNTVVTDNPIIITGGYVFTLSRTFKLKPSTLLKLVDFVPVEYDLNLNLLIDEVLWVGASIRTFNAIDLIVDMQLTNQLRFGYSYAITSNSFNQVDLGSHEFMINYRFKFPKDRVITPRHF